MSNINHTYQNHSLQAAVSANVKKTLNALTLRNHALISDDEFIEELKHIVISSAMAAFLAARAAYKEAYQSYLDSLNDYDNNVELESTVIELVSAENSYIKAFVDYGNVAFGISLDYSRIISDYKLRDAIIDFGEQL